MIKQLDGVKRISNPKVLVTSMFGHEDMLDYLSTYRTQDKFHGPHYYPKGALCWFETNQYGDPNGTIYYVRKIPDIKMFAIPQRQRGFKRFMKQQKKKLNYNELLARELPDTEQWTYDKKHLVQSMREVKQNASKKGNRNSRR